jgi:hypothetical protein
VGAADLTKKTLQISAGGSGVSGRFGF